MATKEKQKIVMRGMRAFRLDTFKLTPAKLLSNVSATPNQPKFQRIDHTHFFHSHNPRTGVPVELSTFMGGHYHKIDIEWDVDKDGEKYVKKMVCGPAIIKKEVMRAGRNLPVTKYAKIRWKSVGIVDEESDMIDLDQESTEFIYDDHIHELEYLYSANLDSETTKRIRSEQRTIINAAMDKGSTPQSNAAQKLQQSAQSAPAVEG